MTSLFYFLITMSSFDDVKPLGYCDVTVSLCPCCRTGVFLLLRFDQRMFTYVSIVLLYISAGIYRNKDYYISFGSVQNGLFRKTKYLRVSFQNISVEHSETTEISVIYASLLRKKENSSTGLQYFPKMFKNKMFLSP